MPNEMSRPAPLSVEDPSAGFCTLRQVVFNWKHKEQLFGGRSLAWNLSSPPGRVFEASVDVEILHHFAVKAWRGLHRNDSSVRMLI
jgi:hypothetical protein